MAKVNTETMEGFKESIQGDIIEERPKKIETKIDDNWSERLACAVTELSVHY